MLLLFKKKKKKEYFALKSYKDVDEIMQNDSCWPLNAKIKI